MTTSLLSDEKLEAVAAAIVAVCEAHPPICAAIKGMAVGEPLRLQRFLIDVAAAAMDELGRANDLEAVRSRQQAAIRSLADDTHDVPSVEVCQLVEEDVTLLLLETDRLRRLLGEARENDRRLRNERPGVVLKERKDTRVHLVSEIEAVLATPGLGSVKSAKLRAIAEGCKRGEAHDFKSPHVCGKMWVVGMLRDAGCAALANRVIDGEFDEEADAEDQAEMAAELADSPALRKMLKLPDVGRS